MLYRSLVFVPGNNPRFITKAPSLGADIICLDLEDSVPAAQKKQARTLIGNTIEKKKPGGPALFVRTNSPASGLIPEDIEVIARSGLDGIVIPKVDDTDQLYTITRILEDAEKKRGLKPIALAPSIESARGAINCYGIASSARVCAIIFGVFDLLDDMRIEYTKDAPGAAHARAKVALEAAAAGVASVDGIWQDLDDEDGLKRDCIAGRQLGYSGKSVIHPSQIRHVHAAFAPTASELEWARRVCEIYSKSAGRGTGATTIGGKMVDEVHYRRARSLLDTVSK